MKNIKLPLVVTLIVLGIGGVALAYFWGAPYGGPGAGPYGGHPGPSPYMWGHPGPWGMGAPYAFHHEWGPGPKAYFRAQRMMGPQGALRYGLGFKDKVEALSKVSGIPAEKLKGVFEKYPMPPKLALKAVSLSLLLNKDFEEVAKELKDNPSLYLWKSGVDPSALIKKEWELRGKLFQEFQGFKKQP